MTAEELFDKVFNKAKEFGLIAKNDSQSLIDPKGNSVVRRNISTESFKDGKAYFGFIRPEENFSQTYSDFSFVVFPDDPENVQTCVVCLGIGSGGFVNDFQIASQPGIRRHFLKLRDNGELTYFKTSFSDNESASSDLLKEIRKNYKNLSKVIETYKKELPACRIVKFENNDNDSLNVIYNWLATYAKIRSWGNNEQKKVVEEQLKNLSPNLPNDEDEIKSLLDTRKYVVLQGAPGTGKTYTALNISEKYNYKTFFEQFHAETTYSDFVCGIEPNLEAQTGESQFMFKEGILHKALEYAQKHEEENVLLIIDEINRANLSNVLGPVFYLFESLASERPVEFEIGKLKINKLPENFFVIATMNTADRSLAVVDFALRRRFAWYTLRPRVIKPEQGKYFDKELFEKFDDIFSEYANDEELNLQPGQSYFIVSNNNRKDEMKNRMIYELIPLIKEYLAEGYMLKAKDSFFDLFLKETGCLMYE